jgi:hypothetical protein
VNVPPLWNTIISLVFLALGGIALYTMLSIHGRLQAPDYQRYARLHRWAGWLFVGLFLVVFVFMLARIESYWEESSARIALHVTLAIALFCLLTIKVLIPRFFPKLLKNMFVLGTSVYLLAFTLVWITAGYYIIWKYEDDPYISKASLTEHMMDQELGKELFIDECGTCHQLSEIMLTRSVTSWEEVVNRMIKLAEPRITSDEGAQILNYLIQTHTPKIPKEGSVMEKYCLPCHQKPSEILRLRYSRSDWLAVVQQMREYGPEIIPADKSGEIVDFLLETQQEATE